MKTTRNTGTLKALAIATLLASLAACGGGGGGDATPDNGGENVTPAPELAPASLQVRLPSSYADGSPQQYMFEKLNDARVTCGFGALRHDTRLDTSAQNHATWIARSDYEITHTEVSGTPGYSGVNSRQRAAYASYVAGTDAEFPGSSASLFLTGEGISGLSDEPADAYKAHIPIQLSVVYHALGLLRGDRDIGFGMAKRSAWGYSAGSIVLHNTGSESSAQKIAEGAIATYPCNGVENVRTFHANETPNPLGTRDLAANPPGHPVMIASRWGTKLTDIAVVMNNNATNAEVQMAAIRTVDNDTSGLMLRNEAFAIPSVELEKSTVYRVKVTGKVDGRAFESNFNFTTGTLDRAAANAGRNE